PAQNCKALQKEKFLMQDKKKSHGKADACRGFLAKYCAKRVFLKQFRSYGTPPKGLPLFSCPLVALRHFTQAYCSFLLHRIHHQFL
ncbi:MAG: hypothetical protein IKD01_01250, partial [Oscillospiraceae bacterium]|nr:hypothetical protein [Oscillospiraceae bacterium]